MKYSLIYLFFLSTFTLPVKNTHNSVANFRELNVILTTFDFFFVVSDSKVKDGNSKTKDMTKNLMFYIDDGPYSARESVYIRINSDNIPRMDHALLILQPKDITDANIPSTVFTVLSNAKSGIAVDETHSSEYFSVRIEPSVDLSNLVLLVSRLGLITRQESTMLGKENIGLKLYSDIFSMQPVEYELSDVPMYLPNNYHTMKNTEITLASIYKSLQNMTYHCGVSQLRLEQMRNSAAIETFRREIQSRFAGCCHSQGFNDYITFIKAVIKTMAIVSEIGTVPAILEYPDALAGDRFRETRRLLELSYRKSKLRNEVLEREIHRIF